MDEQSASANTGLTSLAAKATNLAMELDKLQFTCGHESTAQDISNITEELMLLEKVLNGLNQAISSKQEQYTRAFDEDLAEICNHLGGIFDDISDCCTEMHKADGLNTKSVGWLRKKRYVSKLQKHLQANKTTLVVMRTVLHHGKEYGMQKSVF